MKKNRDIHSKIMPISNIGHYCKALRVIEKEIKIVLTSGAYDVVHDGHPLYLQEARRQGDVLIVGVDEDALVRKNKGPRRPYNNQKTRSTVVAAFECVDIVVVMHDIEYLISDVVPDILVMSESTKANPLEGRENQVSLVEQGGGTVIILPPMSDVHTTSILKKMNGDGRQLTIFDINNGR